MGSFVENVNKLAINMPVNGWASLDEKVDKVVGKQLSSEDYTLTEKNKLAGIAIQATQNSSDAVLLNRGNHTGTQSIDTIEESDTLKILTAAEREKLDAMSPHPSKHHVSIIDGSLNPAKFIKSDAVGNVGFYDVTWSDIQGKPSSYNPNAHQHSLSDLSDAILKADKTYVDTQLATKVDTSTLTTELVKKADANTVATDAELQAAVATLQPLSQKGQANGYVPLDSGGKIPNSYLNNLSTIEVFTANSQANMLLLSNVSVGDQCIRTDLASSNLFILTQTPSTELTNWKQINTSASVLSVNGQTGVVNVSKTDVGLGNVDNTADVNKSVLSATKLATARTISLTSDVTGSANFDGSGNISITATVADNSHNHTLSNISDFPSTVSATELGYLDGVTSNIQTQISAKQATLVSATNIKTINGNTILGSGDLIIACGDMMKATYDTTNNGIVDRAETATKLSNARDITLTGDASGTVSFDGSANVSITVAIADDSHAHAFTNLTGKPTTLSGYGITDAATSTHNHDASYVAKNSAITANTKAKITYDTKGLITAGADLAEADIPSLSTSKITGLDDLLSQKSDKATTIAGYGITNAYTKTEVDNAVDALKDVPQNAKTAAYTLTLTDRGKSIDTSAGVTVPLNSTVAFPIGTVITITNTSAAAITLTQTAGVTLRQAGTSNTGNRTLAAYGMATLRKVASDTWFISGAGLS